MSYKCKKHPDKELRAKLNDLKNDNGACSYCGDESRSEKQRLPLQEVKQEFINKGYIPLFDTYKNNNIKLLAQTKEGYKIETYFSMLKVGQDPRKFDKSNPYTIENIKLWLKLNNKSFGLISDKYTGAIQPLKWKCLKCNNIFEMDWHHIYRGQGCQECNESKGEKRISNYLKLNSIVYEPQKQFNNLVGIKGGFLLYDFYLLDCNLLIEYQGNFHDGSGRNNFTKINLKRTQEHDKRKREYAQQNNIQLLEIWYWDFDNIEKILGDFLLSKNNQIINK